MTDPLPIVDDAKARVTRQDYRGRPSIDGVSIVELRRFVDDGGELAELFRVKEDGMLAAFPRFRLRQSNYSSVEPGGIKAWHLHYKQADVWFVPPAERLLVGLYDLRRDSPTQGVSLRIVLGAGHARLLYIPPGVAHGSANLSDSPVTVFYLHDREFDPHDHDEHRLPWDELGADFWTARPG